ncbi:MAG: hypothetical protein R3C01_01360 [Planctomycetaceae bacterium]
MIRPRFAFPLALVLSMFSFGSDRAEAQLVPGTGVLMNFDDFEDAAWGFTFNYPKSSKEEDEQIRYPLGQSSNQKWFESPKRGIPDVVKRVETPPGGLSGSTGAMYLRTRDTGIPGRPGTVKQAQDDIILTGQSLTLNYSPSTVVRVYLPEWDQWERRNGVTFGYRMGLQGPMEKPAKDRFGKLLRRSPKMVTEIEPYYPGFFIQFNPKETAQNGKDHAMLLIRANENGHEIPGPVITEPGWWTLGMSVTPDARVHYYAKAGVEDLTAKDLIVSTKPYNIPGTHFNTIFFNVVTPDDGKSWSTPWIIDDPKVFYVNTQQTATRPAQPTTR